MTHKADITTRLAIAASDAVRKATDGATRAVHFTADRAAYNACDLVHSAVREGLK